MSIKKQEQKSARKRQWGAEKRTTPLSMLHDKPSTSKLALSRMAILFTVVFWMIYIFSIIVRQLIDGPQNYLFTMEAFSYSFVVSVLTFSSLMYLVARHGALQRFSKHIRVPRSILDKYFTKNKPVITVLVPSYNEEPQVIRKTLLSAALQEYPKLRVVLLLDNKPNPTNPEDIKRLKLARALGNEIAELLSKPYKRFNDALESFKTTDFRKRVSKAEIRILASHYEWASDWLFKMADEEELEDHVDIFFTEQVLRGLARDLKLVAEALNISASEDAHLSRRRMLQLHLRLVWIFQGEFEVFERKQYASLSHEANKAMNLNSYIGLMGGTYRKEQSANGVLLVPTRRKTSKIRRRSTVA